MIKKIIKKLSSLDQQMVNLYAPIFSYFLLISSSLLVITIGLQFIDKDLMKFVLKEDGPSEWLGFFILFYGSLISFYFLFKKFQSERRIDFSYTILTLLAIAMMFAAMEEISYGQRIFNWSSGDFFTSNNAQKETNLHNMVVDGVKVNKLIFGKILFILMVGHNIIFPFLYRKYEWAKKMNSYFGNFIPLLPQVIALAILAIGIEFIDYRRKKEVMEVVGCLYYVLAVITAFGYGIGGKQIKSLAKKTVQKILKWFYVGVPLSALIMTLIYNT